MAQLSRYTFSFHSQKTNRLFLLNYISGSIDIVDRDEEQDIKLRLSSNQWDDCKLTPYMLEQGYLVESADKENEIISDAFLKFQDEYDKTPVQLIFATTYACNFKCSYCFQETYKRSGMLNQNITDLFFQYVDRNFSGAKPYITLFGGEPLLAGNQYKENLLYFFDQAKKRNLSLCIVTNGYELETYIPIFKEKKLHIKEIQVTLDGDSSVHNQRRVTHEGSPTFDRIAAGIDLALESGYRINLRTIIDKTNLETLPSLASYAEGRGWLQYGDSLFETTIGRNYELHSCQGTDSLYTRVEMWTAFLKLAEQHPVLAKYHKPHLHGMRYLAEHGELPVPVFDSCPAAKKEWAFDLNGDIYGCTASVGVEKFRLGNFITGEMFFDRIATWQNRDILTIPECEQCAVAPSCGGGCAVIAFNEKGSILSPDCRPVKDLVSLGISHYKIEEST